MIYYLIKMRPKEILKKWIDCFNASDVAGIAALYADDAVNHQVANVPVIFNHGYDGCKKINSNQDYE